MCREEDHRPGGGDHITRSFEHIDFRAFDIDLESIRLDAPRFAEIREADRAHFHVATAVEMTGAASLSADKSCTSALI
jgi:hypothetical protein